MSHRYRVSVQYRPDRAVFVARAPELPRCAVEADTRGEALVRLEQEIAAQVATMRELGSAVPVPVDEMAPQPRIEGQETRSDGESADAGDEEGDRIRLDGRIRARISPSLHRELLYRARIEERSLDEIVGELLIEGLTLRDARSLRPPRPGRRGEGRPRQRDGQARPRERDAQQAYAEIMESSSSFLQYVRELEQHGQHGQNGHNGPGGRPGRRGRGGRGRNRAAGGRRSSGPERMDGEDER